MYSRIIQKVPSSEPIRRKTIKCSSTSKTPKTTFLQAVSNLFSFKNRKVLFEDQSGESLATVNVDLTEPIVDTEPSVDATETLNFNDIPLPYTVSEWNEKIMNYPWLNCLKGKIGCSICKSVTNQKGLKQIGVHISVEWRSTIVDITGKNREDQMKCFRKKLSLHNLSDAHNNAVKMVEKYKKSVLPKLVDNMNSEHISSTMRIFRTAYLIAKSNRPLSDHPKLVLLQKMNEIDIGCLLHSR